MRRVIICHVSSRTLYHSIFKLFIVLYCYNTSFRLTTEHYAMTQWFRLFQMNRNIIFLYSIMHEKTPIDTGLCV